MADEQDRAALAGDVLHLAQALALEVSVADGEHLVDEQDVRLEVGGDGEAEPHVHAARVVLDRRVEERPTPANSTISSNCVAISCAAHAEDRAVEEDVLAAGQLGVEPGADLEQRADAAVDVDRARRWAR